MAELSFQKHLCHIYRQIGDDGRSNDIALNFGLATDVNALFVEAPNLDGFFTGRYYPILEHPGLLVKFKLVFHLRAAVDQANATIQLKKALSIKENEGSRKKLEEIEGTEK